MSDAIKVNPRQELFCLNVVQGMSDAEAYRAAGYRGMSAHAVMMLKRRPPVQARIAELTALAADNVGATVEELIAEYRKLAMSNLGDVLPVINGECELRDLPRDVLATLSEITTERSEDGRIRQRFKQHSKLAAMDSLAKVFGAFIDRKQVDINARVQVERVEYVVIDEQ